MCYFQFPLRSTRAKWIPVLIFCVLAKTKYLKDRYFIIIALCRISADYYFIIIIIDFVTYPLSFNT